MTTLSQTPTYMYIITVNKIPLECLQNLNTCRNCGQRKYNNTVVKVQPGICQRTTPESFH